MSSVEFKLANGISLNLPRILSEDTASRLAESMVGPHDIYTDKGARAVAETMIRPYEQLSKWSSELANTVRKRGTRNNSTPHVLQHPGTPTNLFGE